MDALVTNSRRSQFAFAVLLGTAAWFGFQAQRRMRLTTREFHFRDRSVIITGGSRGLGLVMARHLAREGARLTILARDAHELARAQSDLLTLNKDILTIVCDVRNESEVRQAVDQVIHHFGHLDAIINNAGVIQVGPYENTNLEDYRNAMDVHFWASLYLIKAALPHLKAQGGGRIVNISSFGGKIAVPHLLPYCASKFALTGLSEGFRAELEKDGILVTTVCPGTIRTGSIAQAEFKGNMSDEYNWFALGASIPYLSVDAERMASVIIEAARHGRADLVYPAHMRMAVILNEIFPEVSSWVRARVAEFLPRPQGDAQHKAKGYDANSNIFVNLLSYLSTQAAHRNNEVPPEVAYGEQVHRNQPHSGEWRH